MPLSVVILHIGADSPKPFRGRMRLNFTAYKRLTAIIFCLLSPMEDEMTSEKSERRKGLTDITLGWIAERLRRTEKIKQDLESGSYEVSTDKVAASILNLDDKNAKSK